MNFREFFIIFLLSVFFKQVGANESESSRPIKFLQSHKNIETYAHVGWESRYILEGRDSLDGESLWSSNIEASYEDLFGEIWYGRSSNNSFREFHLGLGLIQENEILEYYLVYTHLLFPIDKSSDSEWGAGFSYDALPFGLASGLDLVYSVDAKGTILRMDHLKIGSDL